jgi:hypothetical protein
MGIQSETEGQNKIRGSRYQKQRDYNDLPTLQLPCQNDIREASVAQATSF